MKAVYKHPRGMPDILPGDIGTWHRVERAVRHTMHAYGYGEIRTPIVEKTALFERGIGEATDIVEKEMYTFPDRKGESLTLRPENTASCVRAAVEGGLLQPGSVHRVWYQGPMFRYERPQLGRQRQFHQTGAEVYGVAGPAIEAELILMTAALWRRIGVFEVAQLEINTLGSSEDRSAYRSALVEYFQAHHEQLDDDSARRLLKNPLRILDSKNPDLAELISRAPQMADHLSDESKEHFSALQTLLASNGISAVVNPRLVRGLDYYSHTVFEWTTDRLGAQSAICGGGRYDAMLADFGAKNTPGVGWAMGMERIVALMETVQQENAASSDAELVPDAFIVCTIKDDQTWPLQIAEQLRAECPTLRVVQNTGSANLGNQLKRADKLGARCAVILGDDEKAQHKVTIKLLTGNSEAQSVPVAEASQALSSILSR